MLYIAFESLDAAKQHRNGHGGWIFVPNGEDAFPIWFRLGFTASDIFTHPATRGMGGRLI